MVVSLNAENQGKVKNVFTLGLDQMYHLTGISIFDGYNFPMIQPPMLMDHTPAVRRHRICDHAIHPDDLS